MSSTQAERFLCCAVAYRNREDTEMAAVPSTFENEEQAIKCMIDVLWHEAKVSMQTEITQPEDTFLHPVDIDTTEPGIVTSRARHEVMRRPLPLPQVAYGVMKKKTVKNKSPTKVQIPPAQSMEEALQKALHREKTSQEARQQRACKEIKADARRERTKSNKEKKAEAKQETEDERAERLQIARDKRAQKKLEKQQEVNDNANEATQDTKIDPDIKTVTEMLECEADVESNANAVMPERPKGKLCSKMRFFKSPIPYDRHMSALELAGLSDALRNPILHAETSAQLVIIQGPPGTGKTRHLASLVTRYVECGDRVLCCAPTNVGTANLYERILVHHPEASLLLPPSHTPDETPVTVQSPHAQVVCCTISGRNGRLVQQEKFDVVIVDEAAQCMEAWMWSVLREEVHTLIMAGDTQQLPALTSETGTVYKHNRSLMERLVEMNYPTQTLDCQRRMHPHIVAFPNRRFYNSCLQTDYASSAPSDSIPYQIIGVDGTCVAAGTSYVNKKEVKFCVKLVDKLQENFQTVVVITPYQAQARALLAAGVKRVHTVDSFQGHEADAVIISVVRQRDIGFWVDERRLNVALTRAKHCLRIIGSCNEWSGILAELVADAKSRGLLVV